LNALDSRTSTKNTGIMNPLDILEFANLRVSCLAVPPWRFKNRFMNGTPGEVSFRAVFALIMPHAVVSGQMPHATY
jgi:hypothetical protein